MKILRAFILGMLTIMLFIPLVESLAETLCTGMEYFKGVVSKPVLRVNKEIQKLQADIEPIDTVAMGFCYDGEPEEYYDEDDFEDKKKSKSKVGFL